MVTPVVRSVVEWAGLTGVARRALLAVSGSERTVAVDGSAAAFVQRDFGDYIELNQVGAERPAIADLRSAVRPDDVFLDVGSNLGTYAVFVGQRLSEGHVIAVEPVPPTAEKLGTNLSRNGIPTRTVDADSSPETDRPDGATATVCRVLFSDGAGTVEMEVPDAHGSASAAAPPTAGTDPRDRHRVDAVRGDEFLEARGLPAPTVLKVDVEGHEAAVLDGLRETLGRAACRLVYCEVHDSANRGEHVRRRLRSHGFDVERLLDLPGDRSLLRAARD